MLFDVIRGATASNGWSRRRVGHRTRYHVLVLSIPPALIARGRLRSHHTSSASTRTCIRTHSLYTLTLTLILSCDYPTYVNEPFRTKRL
ncbi:hypothetical protein EJ02DRAFT_196348 [Clathrospora elynae]|uniref:Uncharacterized protein n=1 Tax=Clathrospora elynae TaxID=706981 RepID=A0A6A5T4Y4_9PLEO|nr:hypothetical protein EJ02DRAFT_196348 [Clathrospora elynae]